MRNKKRKVKNILEGQVTDRKSISYPLITLTKNYIFGSQTIELNDYLCPWK